jgi:hypothetical protein
MNCVEKVKFSQEIVAHGIVKPPVANQILDIALNLIYSGGDITLSKLFHENYTHYQLIVKNVLSLGFMSNSQPWLDDGIYNLILAFNLMLTHTCLTKDKIEYFGANGG